MNFFKKLFSSKKIIVRIAPSPTGLFHLGTARTALYNYLFTKAHGGKFIVRIEDTDKERSKGEFEKDILDGLSWLGIAYDELFRQSERGDVYTGYIKKLIDSGKAFVSKEESLHEKGKQVEVVRLKNHGETITFEDEVRGEITFDTTELGDFVIARSITEPLYHLAVVVDDHEMEITHVIRGEDHISNTPRQILIQRALGISEPIYAHIPLILASDRSKMSKRKGSTSISEYRENGYLKEALINYLAFLGWNPGTEKEVYSLDELIKDFSLEQVQKGGAVFDINKLNWFNQEHLRALPSEDSLELIENALPKEIKQLPQYSKDRLRKMTEELVERVSTLKELHDQAEAGEFDYFFTSPKIEAKLSWKEDGAETTKKQLAVAIEKLEVLSEHEFTKDTVKEALWSYAEEVGKGSLLWPMRVALSGKDKSPDPFTLAEIFGKEETIKRLKDAEGKL
ncbi:glutamate--tRNA ligase [candidate division KSB1 bacterium]